MTAAPLTAPATLTELLDAIVLADRGRAPLFVLAGLGNALRDHYSLAEPQDFSARIRVADGVRRYELQPQTFRTFPQEGQVMIDLNDVALFRLSTAEHDYFRVFLIAREDSYQHDFETQFAALATEAIDSARDYRLANALEWSLTVRRAESGELQPDTGVKLPDKLRWRLRKPVFRAGEARVLYQWELCSQIDGPYERPLITCVTDKSGVVTRQADLVPIRLMFSRFAAMPKPGVSAPASAVAVAPAASAPPAAAKAAPVEDKALPEFRRKALADKQRAAEETQMEKIRRLFEMPD